MPIYFRTADGKPPMGGRPPNFPSTVPTAPFAPAKEEKKKEEKSSKEVKSSGLAVHVALSARYPWAYPPLPMQCVVPSCCCSSEAEKKPEKKDKKKEKKVKEAGLPMAAWVLPKPPEPKVAATNDKKDKKEKSKEKGKDKSKDKAKEKSSSNDGTLLLPPTVKIHLLKRGYKPWHPKNAGEEFPFKVARVPPSVTVKEFLEVLFEGTKMKNDEKVVVECLERGGGLWAQGSSWKQDGDESKQRLFEVGWVAKRGTDMKPVWLAWG